MNYEVLAILVLVVSFSGMVFLVLKGSSSLVMASNNATFFEKKDAFTKKTKDVIKEKRFSFQLFLQKMLTKARIITLKMDNKITSLNQSLKKKTKNSRENID